MKRYAFIALMLAGCQSPLEEFRGAAPSSQVVALNMPAGAGAATKSVKDGATPELLGERATFFEITRGVTAIVNGGVGVTLLLLEAITDQQPTTLTADHATWGPYTGALDINTWKFDVVEESGPSTTATCCRASRAAPTTAPTRRSSPARRTSSRASSARATSCSTSPRCASLGGIKAQGGISVHYDNTGSPRVVEVAFKDFADGNGNYTPNDALYKYAENGDHSGSFEFVTKADVDHDPLRVQETVAIKSEWLGTGQGKSNAGATGGSLASDATLEECWNTQLPAHLLHRLVESVGDRRRRRLLQAVAPAPGTAVL